MAVSREHGGEPLVSGATVFVSIVVEFRNGFVGSSAMAACVFTDCSCEWFSDSFLLRMSSLKGDS